MKVSKLSIAFRTDASLDIGTGHVMRCLTLADALRERGATCRFICRAHPGNLIDLIHQRGHKVIALPLPLVPNTDPAPQSMIDEPAHTHWLGTNWAMDASETRVALGADILDWLIVDHYALDTRWERSLRAAYRRLMVIDDLADRAHDCDLLLDQNLGRSAEDYDGRVASRCTVLVGPRYALVRPEFPALRTESLERRQDPQLKRLLITMGGVDKYNATSHVLDALRQLPLPVDFRIVVVMGLYAPWLEEVRMRAEQMPCRTEVRVNVSEMAALMAESDLAIGAAGSTAWERCCLGLPSILLVLAENQQVIAQGLEKAGAAKIIKQGQCISEYLVKLAAPLIESPVLLGNMIQAAGHLVNGEGVDIVAKILES